MTYKPNDVVSFQLVPGNQKKCHAELDSASHKIKESQDPDIVDPEINSGP
jgi:hypothetical protein